MVSIPFKVVSIPYTALPHPQRPIPEQSLPDPFEKITVLKARLQPPWSTMKETQ